jgi:hypothetical protein
MLLLISELICKYIHISAAIQTKGDIYPVKEKTGCSHYVVIIKIVTHLWGAERRIADLIVILSGI